MTKQWKVTLSFIVESQGLLFTPDWNKETSVARQPKQKHLPTVMCAWGILDSLQSLVIYSTSEISIYIQMSELEGIRI